MAGSLGSRKASLDVKLPNLFRIEEFRRERDLNEINEISLVRTVFGLVDQIFTEDEGSKSKSLSASST